MTLLEDLSIGLFVPNSGTLNEIRNPSGENGTTSGWEEIGTLDLTASSTSGGPLDHGIAGAKFIGATTVSGGPLGKAQTIPYPCVENDYVAVKYDVPYIDGYHKIGFQFLDPSGNPYGSPVMSGYRTASGGATQTFDTQATIGSSHAAVRVVIEHYSTNTGTAATSGQEIIFRNVMLGVALTAVAAAAVVDRGVWADTIKGAHASVKVTRRPMDLASVAARLKPEQLPVGMDAVVKPGAEYRIKIGTDQLAAFTLTERGSEESTTKPVPLTTLEGADAARALGLRKEYRVSPVISFGPPSLAPLWEAFSDSDVPWRINGSAATGSGLVSEGTINTNMTAIDQIVLARDLNAPAYAWMDRLGVGNVADLAHLSTTPAAVLDESTYSQLVTGFDMDSCFNIVKLIRITGEELGTFTDYESVEEWGERPVTLKVLHNMSEPDPFPKTFAENFLGLNSDPVFQVLSVRIPLHKINDASIALLDLYDLVTVQNTERGIDEDLRVTFIEHEITPLRSGSKWIMTLGFSVDGIAAIPQVLPDPPS